MDKSIIVIVGSREEDARLAASRILSKYGNEYEIIKSIKTGAATTPDDALFHSYADHDTMRELSGAAVAIDEAGGGYEAFLRKDIFNASGKKTGIVIASPLIAAQIINRAKKEGDIPVLVAIKATSGDSIANGMSEDEFALKSELDAKMLLGLRKNNLSAPIVIDEIFSNIEDFIVPEHRHILKHAESPLQAQALQLEMGREMAAQRALQELKEGRDKAEKLKETHIALLAAAAIATTAVGGVWPALLLSGIAAYASKARREHVGENWFLRDGFSAKDGLLFALFSGLAPEEKIEGIQTKRDLQDAIERFKLIRHENANKMGLIEKALLVIGDKVIETSLSLQMMNTIKEVKQELAMEAAKELKHEEKIESGADILLRPPRGMLLTEPPPAESDDPVLFNSRRS